LRIDSKKLECFVWVVLGIVSYDTETLVQRTMVVYVSVIFPRRLHCLHCGKERCFPYGTCGALTIPLRESIVYVRSSAQRRALPTRSPRFPYPTLVLRRTGLVSDESKIIYDHLDGSTGGG